MAFPFPSLSFFGSTSKSPTSHTGGGVSEVAAAVRQQQENGSDPQALANARAAKSKPSSPVACGDI